MANKYCDGNSLLAIRTYIAECISSALSTVYKFKGSKTVAQVNGTASSGNIDYATISTGDVYNISDAGTIVKPTGTSLTVSAGDNIAWNGTTWDKLAGDIDLSGYVTIATAQTITGEKTFLAQPIVANGGGLNFNIENQGNHSIVPSLANNGETLLYVNEVNDHEETFVFMSHLSGYVTLTTNQTITGTKTMTSIKAGGTYNSVANAYFDIQFGSGVTGSELAFKWDNVSKNITLDNDSGSLILTAEEKVYYGGTAAGNEVVIKSEVECYTESYALEVLRQGSLNPTI